MLQCRCFQMKPKGKIKSKTEKKKKITFSFAASLKDVISSAHTDGLIAERKPCWNSLRHSLPSQLNYAAHAAMLTLADL